MTKAWNSSAGGIPRWLVWGWTLVVALLAFHQLQFWRSPKIDTDVFALLPHDEQSPIAQMAMRQLAEQGERRVVVMLGGADWEVLRQVAQAMGGHLAHSEAGLQPTSLEGMAAQTMDFYKPWRDVLLTASQKAQLSNADADQLARGAMSRLHGLNAGQPTNWLSDPLGLWTAWWTERSGITAARPRDGILWVADPNGKRDWAVLLLETKSSAFTLSSERRWYNALQQAKSEANRRVAHADTVQMLLAGIPLFAEAGAAQGNSEMNSIGLGSMAGIILLVWWTLRAVRPIALIGLSLAVGCAAAVSVTVLVFGQIHMLTLVFGASLVGVAVDYGINYFGSRLGNPNVDRWILMKDLLIGLALALSTSVVGYAVMAVTPFPGLRQVALFSGVGLIAAFATVVCWFPVLDRGDMKGSQFADKITSGFMRWPKLTMRQLWIFISVFGVVSGLGITRLTTSDDIRQLQSSPPELVKEQMDVGRLLRMPSPAQFFMVQGASEQEVLEREEALKERLAPALGFLGSADAPVVLSALSDWIPSEKSQLVNRSLTSKAEMAVLTVVSKELGEDLRRPEFAANTMKLQNWLDSPASMAARSQWLGKVDAGFASIVLIRGLQGRAQLQTLRSAALDLPGIQLVDRAQDMTTLLGRLSSSMTWLLVVGHALVWGALAMRYRGDAWRAWLPTALASVGTLGVLGFAGEPFQLFNLLALILMLGMGVDYGIFLLEHQGRNQPFVWLGVLIGALSTAMSFGLLALSKTPALHTFGLTLLVGLGFVCVLTPCLRLSRAG
jgi:predicted exporter